MCQETDYAIERQRLLDCGYKNDPLGEDVSLFRKEDQKASILLFRHASSAVAVATLAGQCPGNIFLPRVLNIEPAGQCRLMMTEPLLALQDLPPNLQRTCGGHAAAYVNFPLGDAIHAPVHACFRVCSHAATLSEAVGGLASALEDSISRSSPLALNISETAMLFRRTPNGAIQEVFANPFRLAASVDETRQQAEQVRERRQRLLSPQPVPPRENQALALAPKGP